MVFGIAAALGALLAVAGWRVVRYAADVEPNQVEVTRHEVAWPDLPVALDGATICQVSDLHAAAGVRNIEAVTRALCTVTADLYVFTGDMIYLQSGIPPFFRWLDQVGEAVRPAVAILGNAEHKSYVKLADVLEGMERRGIPVLRNEVRRFPLGDGEVQVVGVDDPHTHRSDFAAAYSHADPAAWTLLLCHSPDGLAEIGDRRADLILCGHTHGGQLRLPGVGAVWANTRRVKGRVSGWYDRPAPAGHRSRIYVSRGLGTGGVPARLLCPPELTVFTLRRG